MAKSSFIERNKAVREAWIKEQNLVQEGKGTRAWTPEQQKDILEKGKAYDDSGKAIEGQHMKSAEQYPEYQGDPGNIQFLTRAEHLEAHNGNWQNPTNWYFNPVTKEKIEFGDGPFIPCETIQLPEPIIKIQIKSDDEKEVVQPAKDIQKQQIDSVEPAPSHPTAQPKHMNGDGTAVKANKYHNLDPSNKVKSICIIDGDSKQKDDPSEGVFRLPGEAPELYVFDEVVDKIDTCSGMLAVRFMREFTDAPEIKQTILAISKTNRDHHLIFSQIGEAVGFVDESVIVNAFLSTWCSHYKDEVTALLDKIKNQLLLLENEHL